MGARPDHIFVGTDADIALARINADKTECWRGHPLSGDNLAISKTGGRTCRACSRINTAQHRARKKEKSVA